MFVDNIVTVPRLCLHPFDLFVTFWVLVWALTDIGRGWKMIKSSKYYWPIEADRICLHSSLQDVHVGYVYVAMVMFFVEWPLEILNIIK